MQEPTSRLEPSNGPPAQHVGKYRLVKKLAAGGMAQIYLAVIEGPEGFSKPVVVKTVLPEFEDIVEFNRMFVREAKTVALFSHPNIVQVFDFGKVDNRFFLAMEWVDGVSLEQLMRRAALANLRLGYRVALNIGLALSEALSYVQSLAGPDGVPLGIVHRDVTPGNTLISKTGLVKLTDFGVVKTAAFPSCTQGGEIKGKFDYMSPEQLRNEPLDGRTDVYAVGIMLYEVATGRRLFKRPVLAQTMKAILENDVPAPSTLCPDFPEMLERIVMRALAPKREDRYPGARELLADLEAFRSSAQWTASARDLAALLSSLFSANDSRSNGRTTPTPRSISEAARPRTTSGVPSPSAAGVRPVPTGANGQAALSPLSRTLSGMSSGTASGVLMGTSPGVPRGTLSGAPASSGMSRGTSSGVRLGTAPGMSSGLPLGTSPGMSPKATPGVSPSPGTSPGMPSGLLPATSSGTWSGRREAAAMRPAASEPEAQSLLRAAPNDAATSAEDLPPKKKLYVGPVELALIGAAVFLGILVLWLWLD